MEPLLFFPSSPFFLLALSCSPYLFPRQCDFGSYSSSLITYLLTPFRSNDRKLTNRMTKTDSAI